VQHLIERDRQVAHPHAGRVVDGIGDRCRDPHDPDLAESFHPERVDQGIRFVDEDHLDVVDVGVNRHMVLGDVVVDDPAKAVVVNGFLMQRLADAADDGASASSTELSRRR